MFLFEFTLVLNNLIHFNVDSVAVVLCIEIANNCTVSE